MESSLIKIGVARDPALGLSPKVRKAKRRNLTGNCLMPTKTASDKSRQTADAMKM